MMAVSPLFFIAYLGLSARLGAGDSFIEGDPDGYSDRLEAYLPFIRAATVLAEDKTANPEEADAALELALAEASAGLPHLESTKFGLTADTDVRQPIVSAQARVFEVLVRKANSLAKSGATWNAVELAVRGFSIADLTRHFDSRSLNLSTSQQVVLANFLRRQLSHLDADQLERLSHRLIAYEAKRKGISGILRNEMHLLTMESRCWIGDFDRIATLSVALEALRTFRRGESIEGFIQRTARWEASPAKSDVWSTLVSWELASRSEDHSQRVMRSLIVEVRSRQLAMRGEKFDTIAALRLPASFFAETIKRNEPTLVIEGKWACLHYDVGPLTEIVAMR